MKAMERKSKKEKEGKEKERARERERERSVLMQTCSGRSHKRVREVGAMEGGAPHQPHDMVSQCPLWPVGDGSAHLDPVPSVIQ